MFLSSFSPFLNIVILYRNDLVNKISEDRLKLGS